MPTLRCPGCGKAVKFEGVAGVCPHCAAIVRAAKPSTTQKQTVPSVTQTRSGRSGHSGVDLKDLDALGHGEEVFEPTTSPSTQGGSPFAAIAALDKRLLYTIFAAIFFVTVFGLYVVLRKPAADDATNQPAPAPVSYQLAPPPPKPQPIDTAPKPVERPKASLQSNNQTTQPTSRPSWAVVKPVVPIPKREAINDKMVEASITKGVGFLKGQFTAGALTDANNSSEGPGGGDALAVYALLHSSQAIDDPDLNPSGSFISSLLDRVKRYEMEKGKPIYERSLRAAALAMLDREQDRSALEKDKAWLLKAEVNGAYGYEMPPPHVKPEQVNIDNSTSQFGVLGVWAIATTGQAVPDKYWADVEKHWLACQDTSGGWSYNGNGTTPTMTAAGIASLCVASEYEQQAVSRGSTTVARPALSKAVDRALDYLGKDDNVLSLSHEGYGLYTIERAALATGFRWFGKHDWYRELGATQITRQRPDGSWDGSDGTDVQTSFNLLFLSRGRQPLLMDKLRFAGDWDDRPRDVSKIASFASVQLEKPFAWGVADLNRDWWDWLEAPVLFISTDTPPEFSDEDCAKLRNYAEAGGLIFLHNEFGSKQVDAFASDLARRVFPTYPLTNMAPDDLLYSAVFKMKTKPAMKSVSNGTRTLMVYSPKDITLEWVRYRPHDNKDNPALQVGLNLFVDGAGKSDFRNRLNTPYVGPVEDPPLATVPVAQVMYPGSWNPEPGAWLRFPRWFQNQTSFAVDIRPTDIKVLDVKTAPVAMMTGNTNVDFSELDTHALRDYVDRGGVLFIDSTGGNKAFANAVRSVLLPMTFPGLELGGMPGNHPVLTGTFPCGDAIPKPHVRNFTASTLNGSAPTVQFATFGKGTVIVSDLDVTTGLLNSGTYGINGYTPAYCQSLVKNIILWAMSRYGN